ncbi:MAG: hypothetical protein H6563_05630 [Lewinellaceae bacterium]|nr:hypothetical protein [Lewinellaceae bacterium]
MVAGSDRFASQMKFADYLKTRGMADAPLAVWAFIPYWQVGPDLVSESYDTPQTRRELDEVFHALGLTWTWVPVTTNGLPDTVEFILQSANGRKPLILNFCDADPVFGGPGIDVIHKLEEHDLAFTGADAPFYHISTSKILMKEAFQQAGVPTAPFAVITDAARDIPGLCEKLGAPLFVKPAVSAGSFGLSLKSVVHSDRELYEQVQALLNSPYQREFSEGGLFVERFLNGPEFTVLVVGMPDVPESIRVYPPVERAFNKALPETERFFSYDRYWELYREEERPPDGKPLYEYLPAAPAWKERLEDLAWKAYCAVGGAGYGRVDIRMDRATGEFFVLEVNANCGISADENESSTGQILRWGGIPFTQLMSDMLFGALVRVPPKFRGK